MQYFGGGATKEVEKWGNLNSVTLKNAAFQIRNFFIPSSLLKHKN
jgi:hypothetical protein